MFSTYEIDNDLFQSTPSAWRETGSGLANSLRKFVFQSTPSAWRETALCVFDD